MKAKFINDKLDYVFVNDCNELTLSDKNCERQKFITNKKTKLFAFDGFFMHLVFVDNDKALYYYPLSWQPRTNLVCKQVFDESIDSIAVNKDYVFVNCGCNIYLLLDYFRDSSSSPIRKITLESPPAKLEASDDWLVCVDSMFVHVYDLKSTLSSAYAMIPHNVHHDIYSVQLSGNICEIISSQATLIHRINIKEKQILPSSKLGFMSRNVLVHEYSSPFTVVISDNTIHLFNSERNDEHKTIPINSPVSTARIVKNKLCLLHFSTTDSVEFLDMM